MSTLAHVCALLAALCLMAPTALVAAQCSFDTFSEKDVSFTYRQDGVPRSFEEQFYLPDVDVSATVQQGRLLNPNIAVDLDIFANNAFQIINRTSGDPMPLAHFNQCESTTVRPGTTFVLVPDSVLQLRTPSPDSTPFNVTLLSFDDGISEYSIPETVVYQCGCPDQSCSLCSVCQASCPLSFQQSAPQVCKSNVIPDSVCVDTPQRTAISAIKAAAGITDGTWPSNAHHCDWTGVTCDAAEGNVTGLSLVGSALGAALSQLPPQLAALPHIEALSLEGLGLATVDAVIQQLPNLAELSVRAEDFEDSPIPAFVWTLPLRHLVLAGNRLRGNLSATDQQLVLSATLQEVDLSGNALMGQPPLAAGDSHVLNMHIAQITGFQFACNADNATQLSLGAMVDLMDVVPTECSPCGATYPLQNIVQLPPPAPAVGDSVEYTCGPGFQTPTTQTTFSLVCRAGVLCSLAFEREREGGGLRRTNCSLCLLFWSY